MINSDHSLVRMTPLKVSTWDEDSISTLPSSRWGHYGTSIGKYKGQPFVVGGGNIHVEIYENERWHRGPDLPFLQQGSK